MDAYITTTKEIHLGRNLVRGFDDRLRGVGPRISDSTVQSKIKKLEAKGYKITLVSSEVDYDCITLEKHRALVNDKEVG